MKKTLLSLIAALGLSAGAWAMTPASYPGGAQAYQNYIAENLQYPDAARQNGIEGDVSVLFTVKADGTIGNIQIKRMVDPDLESEAIRLVKLMPAWNPARDDAGNPMESAASLTVSFSLEK